MIKTEVLSVRNPRWTSEDHSAIDCLVRTNTLVGEVPFTASMHDSELHGRETYARCVAGEFGEIAPMEPRNAPVLLAHVAPPSEYQRLEIFLLEANRENNRKSFRSVAIVWASLLDNLLNELLEADAIRVAATGQLIGKPPRKFSSRIKKALNCGLIDQEDADKCDYIRCIRNAAAHDWELSLESEDVLPNLRRLHEADHARILVFHEDLDFLIQQVYVASCSMLVMRFVERLP